MIEFDKFKEKPIEGQVLEIYVTLSNLERGQRKNTQDTATVLELVNTLVETTVKNQFQRPDPETQQTPPTSPKPKVQQNLDEVEEWIPEREEIEVFKQEWKKSDQWENWSAMSSDYPELVKAIKNSYKETLDYGDHYLKLGGDEEGFINLNERKFRNPDGAPSDGQLKVAKNNRVDPEGHTSKTLSIAIADTMLSKRIK